MSLRLEINQDQSGGYHALFIYLQKKNEKKVYKIMNIKVTFNSKYFRWSGD